MTIEFETTRHRKIVKIVCAARIELLRLFVFKFLIAECVVCCVDDDGAAGLKVFVPIV